MVVQDRGLSIPLSKKVRKPRWRGSDVQMQAVELTGVRLSEFLRRKF